LEGLGHLFLGIGIVLLIAGLIVSVSAYNALRQVPYVGEMLGETVFMATFTPYAASGGALLAVGTLLAYVGMRRGSSNGLSEPVMQTVNVLTPHEYGSPTVQVDEKPPSLVPESTSRRVDDGTPPLPKQGICPSCECPIVFIEKYQRWYCVYERKYI
jgi:hypothetical protein